MKLMRSLSLLLALIVVLGCLPLAAGAQQAAPGRLFGGALLDADEKLLAAAEVKETLYLLSSEALYELKPGEAQLRRVAAARPAREDKGYQEGEYDVIFGHQDQLYGLNLKLGLLYELQLGTDSVQATLKHKLDVRGLLFGEGRYASIHPRCIYAHEGRLYILAQAKRTNDNNCFSYDLETGKLKKHKSTQMRMLTAYKDGLLLVSYHNPKIKVKDDWSNYIVLGILDPAKDTIRPFEGMPEDALNGIMGNYLYYDAPRDRVLVFTRTELLAVGQPGGPERLLRLPVDDFYYFPLASETPGLLPLSGDRLLISFMKESFIRPLDPGSANQELELVLSHPLPDSKAFQKALMQMDGVSVRTLEGGYSWSEQELATKLLTDTLGADILVLDSSRYDVQGMMRKGYLSALDASPAMRTYAEGLMPALLPLMKDGAGQLMALPLSVSFGALSMQMNNAREAGVQPPSDLPALLDMVESWAASDDGRHDGFLLTAFAPIKPRLKQLAHAAYVAELLGEGQELQYDMASFGALMQRIDQLDLQGIDFADQENLDDRAGMRKPILFESGGYHLWQLGAALAEQPLLLPTRQGAPLRISGSATLLGIYARSDKQEAAARFIEAYLQHVDPLDTAMMSPAQAEAIPNPDYERALTKNREWVDSLKLQISEAKGAEKRQLEEDLKLAERTLAEGAEQLKWLATAEALERNHQLMARVFFPDSLGLQQLQAMAGPEGLFQRYVQGGLSLEQFISRANDMLRMVRLEAR